MSLALPGKTIPIKCNILLIGKSGVGKSSFANYLFGSDKFTEGTGKPVTTWEENFQCSTLMQDGIEINVYDSVGLENDKILKWKEELNKFLKENTNNSTTKPPSEILHAAFYLINAKGARVENGEIDIIKDILRYNLSAAVVLTNCDTASEEEKNGIENTLKEKCSNAKIIRACSIDRETRLGHSKPYGKEKAIATILEGSYEKVGRELLIALLNSAEKKLTDLQDQIKRNIQNSDISFFKMAGKALKDEEYDIDEGLERILGPLTNLEELDFETFIPESYKSYFEFIEKFPIEWQGKDVFQDSIDLLDELCDICEDDIGIYKAMEKAMEDIEEGNLWEKIRGAFTALNKVVFIKKTLTDGVDEIFGKIVTPIKQIRINMQYGINKPSLNI